jgi:hypothetical protein
MSEQSRGQSAENTAATPRIPPASKIIALHVVMIFLIVFPSLFPFFSAEMLVSNCGSRRDEEAAKKILRLIQIRFNDGGARVVGL